MPPALSDVLTTLETAYGLPGPPPYRTLFELIVFENAAYLVDDERRVEVFEALRKRVGLTARAIAGAPDELLVDAIRPGGMRPPDRAAKLRECARLALETPLEGLPALHAESPPKARRMLKRYPGVGDPGADKLLLVARLERSLAPESNGLRALVRLGFGKEETDYGKTYRSVTEAVKPELPGDLDRLLEGHLLLRRHGQEICRRSSPRCDVCPLGRVCPYPRR